MKLFQYFLCGQNLPSSRFEPLCNYVISQWMGLMMCALPVYIPMRISNNKCITNNELLFLRWRCHMCIQTQMIMHFACSYLRICVPCLSCDHKLEPTSSSQQTRISKLKPTNSNQQALANKLEPTHSNQQT